MVIRKKLSKCIIILMLKYSLFHSSLPFEHSGQSSLCEDQVTFYSVLGLKKCLRCQVFLKSVQHLSLGNDVTSSDKNIVIVWLIPGGAILHKSLLQDTLRYSVS